MGADFIRKSRIDYLLAELCESYLNATSIHNSQFKHDAIIQIKVLLRVLNKSVECIDESFCWSMINKYYNRES